METAAAPQRLAAWVGMLFVLVMLLNAAGGWVRVSGSGVAIPHWPVIELDGRRTLLPPFDEAGWQAARTAFDRHQAELGERVARGELHQANLGRSPADLGDFKAMFLTEWFHRLLAALAGVVMLACLVTAWRSPGCRSARPALSVAGGLVVVQALLGGLLVDSGTSTRWLFLHQGNAALIICSLAWALLRLLDGGRPAPERDPALLRLHLLAHLGAAATWAAIVLGGLVAGSRHLIPRSWWVADRGLAWNLLDNPALHQDLHRLLAWAVAALALLGWRAAQRSRLGGRPLLAAQVALTFIAVQILLGFGLAVAGRSPLLVLAHQAMGMLLLAAFILVMHDLRYRRPDAPSA